MISQPEIAAELRKTALFKDLKEEALARIAAKAKVRQFFPDETIVWQGKPSDSLFLIAKGIVAVKKVIGEDREDIFAYLMAGQTFGEVGIMDNQMRSATVSTLSEVDVLVIRRADFFDILHDYPVVAIELARTLGRYLLDANRRQSRGNRTTKVIVVLSVERGTGGSSIGLALCKALREKTKKTVAYTEYPGPQRLWMELDVRKMAKAHHHAQGFDVVLLQDGSGLPTAVRATLLLDDLTKDYDYVVVGLCGAVDETAAVMLDGANQVLLVAPPTRAAQDKLDTIHRELKKYIRPDETPVLNIVNHRKTLADGEQSPIPADFVLPYLADMRPVSESERPDYKPPKPLSELAETCVDRLERTHQIGLFIPTTMDVDQPVDTSGYLERTLAFLAERFGGATSKEAQGVWNSHDAGLVGEKVFVVYTYATQGDMNKYLDEVIEYVRKLKGELKQEAMAVEIDKKLTLI